MSQAPANGRVARGVDATCDRGPLRNQSSPFQPARIALCYAATEFERLQITPQTWNSPHPPGARSIGSPDGEEIWEGISKEQTLGLVRRAMRKFSEDAHAERQPVRASDGRMPRPEDRSPSNPPSPLRPSVLHPMRRT